MSEAESPGLLRARRAYELGRVRAALPRASLLALFAGLLGQAQQGPRAWLWVAAMLVPWILVEVWGRTLRAGARRGVVAGLVTAVVPMQWLRPCCASELADSLHPPCTMPELCIATGALVGLALATAPSRRGDAPLEHGAGMLLGVGSLIWLKCSLMLWGESVGLLAGLCCGVLAVAGLRSLADTPKAN